MIPALQDLTGCILFRRDFATEWRGFVYKAPGGRPIELGLGGRNATLIVWLFGEEWHLNKKIQLKEWHSVCLTWSGQARRLRIYINGTMQKENFVNDTQPQQLESNGTLTLGVSHFIDANGAVKAENGNNLLGEIGLFRMWAREWSSEELRRQSCADGDVVSWDLRQWNYSCPPVPDSSLNCAVPAMRFTMLQLHMCSNLSFTCEVHVNVDPAACVDVVQMNITAMLRSAFSDNLLNLTADPNSISILPVESISLVTQPPPTSSTAVTSSAFGPDTFLRVNVTLSMTGTPAKPKEIIETWLKEKLEVNDTMVVLNVVVAETVWRNMDGPMIPLDQLKQKYFINRYTCTFHVQEYKIHSVTEVTTLIRAALTSKYENGSIVIETTEVDIKHIMPENCFEELTSTFYGEYIWPETFPQVNQVMGCKKPISGRAYRFCKLNIETDTTSWTDPDMTNCSLLVTISDLENVTVTTDNAVEVVDMIKDLVKAELGDTAELSSSELDTVVEKLNQVVDVSIIKSSVGSNIVNIVADILLSETVVTPVANVILNLTERMGNNMEFPGESVSLTAPSVALSMVNVNPDGFNGLTFGVSSTSALLTPTVFINQSFTSEPFPGTDATISLPPAPYGLFTPGESDKTRVQFQFYGTQDLFQADETVLCVFWDFQINDGHGGWNSRGCETSSTFSYQTSCLCDHLTHFAVLLDVSRAPISEADSQILTVISYIGCGISAIFLGITLITYLAFENLRRDYPSKILINLSSALLGLSMLFLLDSWLSSFSISGLCIATAATLHYFLLASFTWMGLEAVHMYLALVKVFNIYVPSYILKFCAVGWGVPLLIVSLVLVIDKNAYGSIVQGDDAMVLQSTDTFCWLQDDVYFYVTVVAFVLLILLCNICVFIVVLIQIRKMRANKPSAKTRSSLQDLRAVASLTVLLGLTWLMGFFSFGPGRVVPMYLFSIFNPLQGFFVFLFHCLMKDNVRKQWRIHLCCGRFRLNDYSDWSRSVTAGGKKNNLVNCDSVASDNTFALRKVSDSSTGSVTKNHKGA
ncbi:adhesion G-protein coupled receptor G6 [Aulostomus maculatus]